MTISPELTLLLFSILFVLATVNLILGARLVTALKRVQINTNSSEPLPTGEVVPALEATQYHDGSEFEYSVINDQAKVFLFLHSHCPKCKTKLEEIEMLVKKSRDMGVSIWLLTEEKPRKFKAFLKETSLFNRALGLSEQVMKFFNPVQASPYYLFLDQNNVLQAEGLIGDATWLEFSQQIETAEKA